MKLNKIALLSLSTLALTACNDSSDDSSSSHTLQGVASQGGGIRGELTLATPLTGSATLTPTSYDGKYALVSDTLPVPNIVKIQGVHAGEDTELYTLVTEDAGTTAISNISPLTRLALSRITGMNADAAFSNIASIQTKLTSTNLKDAELAINAILIPLFEAMNMAPPSFTQAQYQANYTELDAVLSVLDFQFHNQSVTVTYKPEPQNTVTLSYNESWQGKSLLPNGIQDLAALNSMQAIYKANNILEAMPLALAAEDEATYNSYLHPDAHWFGVSKAGLYQAQKAIIGNENTPMDRFRDFQLITVKNNAYLISYTERYQNNIYASAGRRQAWLKQDAQGELKFLGDDTPMPTSANAFLKYSAPQPEYAGLQTDTKGKWLLEIDAFLSSADCQNVPTVAGEWKYLPHQDTSFVSTLPTIQSLNLPSGTAQLVIKGKGINNETVTLDRVYRSPSKGTCHLVTSSSGLDPMTEGLHLTTPTDIQSGSSYKFEFQATDKSVLASKTVQLGKGVQSETEMRQQFNAMPVHLHGQAGLFDYQWQRTNPFMIEADIWAYESYNQPSKRISVPTSETQIQSSEFDNITSMFHTAFDPYGRVITDEYFTNHNQNYLGQK